MAIKMRELGRVGGSMDCATIITTKLGIYLLTLLILLLLLLLLCIRKKERRRHGALPVSGVTIRIRKSIQLLMSIEIVATLPTLPPTWLDTQILNAGHPLSARGIQHASKDRRGRPR